MADYSINAVPRRASFSGSAGVGPYAFTFEILDENDVAVYKNQTLLTLTTDYTVTINANGTGTVTLTSAATSTDTLIILGARDIERTTDFVTAGDLRASSLNEQLDSLTIFDQQIDERVDRAIKVAPYDDSTVDLNLPIASERADKLLKFDTNGAPGVIGTEEFVAGLGNAIISANFVTNTATGDGSTVNYTLSTAPGSKTNVQVYIDGVYQNKASFSIAGATLTFTEAPPLNAAVEFMIGYAVGTTGNDAGDITYTQGDAGSQTRTVESKLQDTVSVKDFGAVGDGTTDDTAAIQAAMLASNHVTFPEGIYLISSQLNATANMSLVGHNATLKVASGSSQTLVIKADKDQTNVLVQGLTIDGNSKPVTGITFVASYCKAINNTVKNCDYGILVASNYQVTYDASYLVDACLVKDNVILNTVYHAIVNQHRARNTVVESNYIEGVTTSGYYGINASEGSFLMTIANNKMRDVSYGIKCPSSRITITGNHIASTNDGQGISVGSNPAATTSWDDLDNLHYNICSNNVVHNTYLEGIIITGERCIVSNNNVFNCGYTGTISQISVKGTDCLVTNNLITSENNNLGIYVHIDGQDKTISNNIILTDHEGIRVDETSRCFIRNNTIKNISGTVDVGINVTAGLSNAQIDGNYFTGCVDAIKCSGGLNTVSISNNVGESDNTNFLSILSSASQCTISNNISTAAATYDFIVSDSDVVTNTVITGNNFYDTSVTSGGGNYVLFQSTNNVSGNVDRSSSQIRTYNQNPVRMGGGYTMWVDATGDLRVISGYATSDTDGTVVGTQS